MNLFVFITLSESRADAFRLVTKTDRQTQTHSDLPYKSVGVCCRSSRQANNDCKICNISVVNIQHRVVENRSHYHHHPHSSHHNWYSNVKSRSLSTFCSSSRSSSIVVRPMSELLNPYAFLMIVGD